MINPKAEAIPAYLKDGKLIFDNKCCECGLEDEAFLNQCVTGDVYCDDCYVEDGTVNCNDCNQVFKGCVPDRRTILGRVLWKEFGTDKIVTLSSHSNITCIKCKIELGHVHSNGKEVRDD